MMINSNFRTKIQSNFLHWIPQLWACSMVYWYPSFTCTHESLYLTLLKKRKLTSDSWTMNISISACLVVKFNYPITIKFFMCLRALMHFHWLVSIQQLLLKRKVHCWLKHHGPKIDWIFFKLSALECLIDKVFLMNNVKFKHLELVITGSKLSESVVTLKDIYHLSVPCQFCRRRSKT